MKYSGGFQGRTNKLVDGCYSFWVGACFGILQEEGFIKYTPPPKQQETQINENENENENIEKPKIEVIDEEIYEEVKGLNLFLIYFLIF